MSADLWDFAREFYARPGVETACLDLQTAGADICLLLCGAWLDRQGVAYTAPRLARLREFAGPWQSTVVTPLRRLRQGWRDAAIEDGELARLREQVKALELEAERQLLRRLEAACANWPRAAACDSTVWLEALGAPGHPALQWLATQVLEK